MENKLFLKFSESCLNLSLRQKDHFISAFPGKIVFGKCTPNGYINKHYFEFELFELYKLYLAIFEIVKTFSDDTIIEKNLVLSKSDCDYFLSVKILVNENSSETNQVASFVIEHDSHKIHELEFLDVDLNTFLYTLEKIVPLSMCLSSLESLFFKTAAKESVKVIHGFQEDVNCKKCVQLFLNKNKEEIAEMELKSVESLITFLSYYCEIILIFHKLQSLIDNSQQRDNMAVIIST